MPIALITERQQLSTAAPVDSNSSTLSRTKISASASAVTKSATVISCIMPCIVLKKWAATNHSELKKTHHAKSIATMLFSCGHTRLQTMSSRLPWSKEENLMIRTTSSTTKKRPAPHSISTWRPECLVMISSGSSPSALGRVPPMRRRKDCTTMKDAASPMTSFSVSAASSFHISSLSSSLPSAFAIPSRSTCVTLLSAKTLPQATGKTASMTRKLCGSCVCSTPKQLMAAKPAMCPKRMPPVLRLSEVFIKAFWSGSTPVLSGAWSLEEHCRSFVPERRPSKTCNRRNHSMKCSTLTKSSKTPSGSSPRTYASTTPFTAWNSSTAEKMEIVELMTIQVYFLMWNSFWLTR
mmetsp:Transcript_71564/g.165508  ORF Transcript_71564/g.165508 Transcript_71564/m.165508 type:complete len:351 (+) Transcript_71564:646-1698(+)